jgi:hypothetical protein
MWGQPAHAVLRLPPLGVLWLEPANLSAAQIEAEIEAEE